MTLANRSLAMAVIPTKTAVVAKTEDRHINQNVIA